MDSPHKLLKPNTDGLSVGYGADNTSGYIDAIDAFVSRSPPCAYVQAAADAGRLLVE